MALNFFDRFRKKKEVFSDSQPSTETPVKLPVSRKKIAGGLILGMAILISAIVFFFFFKEEISDTTPSENLTEAVSESVPSTQVEKLPALEVENGLAEKYQSENFQISHISFGGDATMAFGESEDLPIEIFSVKSDPFLNDKDNESKIAVSWKSNKLTASELTYSLAGGGASETLKENDFGFNHNLVLAPLEEGAAYIFSIKSYDRWGNSQSFGYYGAYSSAKADSIFELIGKTFGETFGWAINR